MSDAESEPLTQDEVYDLLSNARRRFVISYLRDRTDPVDVMDLSETVAAWENDTSREELTDQQTKRVYVSLYQTHIPKLDESGLVEYDKDAGLVSLTPAVRELDTYLPESEENAISWQAIYLGLAVVGLVLYVVSMVFSLLPLSTLGVVLLITFGVLAVTHYELTRRTNR